MKKILSNILHSTLLVALMVSFSSFGITPNGDSLKNPETSKSIPSDEILGVRISTPSAQMIKRADMEMHKSMSEYILKLKSFKVKGFDAQRSDLSINQLFNEENKLNMNINSYLSDNEINNWFYLNIYFNQVYTNFYKSDLSIQHQFETENQ